MKALSEILENIKKPTERAAVCDKHGEYTGRLLFGDLWSRCPGCISEANEAEERLKEESDKQKRTEAWARSIEDAGIPLRFADRTLASFVAETDAQKSALAFSEEYARGFCDVLKTGRSAIFCGSPGTGKTHLAAGIGLCLISKGNSVLFSTVLRAVRRVKDTWSKDSVSDESKAIASLVFPDLLILDEVGMQFGSDTEKLILFDILNERYEKRKPVILISNLDIAGVKSYLGDRIFDRLREDGGQYKAFTWESYRGKATR